MRALSKFLGGVFLAACCTGAQAQGVDIKAALDRILAHPARDERFVVVDDPDSGKFVQFDMRNDEIAIDLPVVALSAAERERATTLFASAGVSGPRTVTDQQPDGREWPLATFQLGFGGDSARAAEFATRVMQEVFLLPRGMVTPAEWARFVAGTVTPRFPGGFTVSQATGQWRSEGGGIVREASNVLVLVHPDDAASERAVREIVAAYKSAFQQEVRVKARACASF